MNNYDIIKNSQLKSIHSDFSFSKEMQTAVRSELWRNKTALWTILSGACDDVAKQCYIKINSMVSDIADIDTCNIHSLKSIAKSVDAEFLVKNLRDDYDEDILELINLFSVPKEYILNSNIILHQTVNDHLFGYLTLKSLSLPEKKVSIDLLYNIKLNIKHIKHIFERNLIPPRWTLEKLIKYDLDDLKVEDLKNSDTINSFLSSLSEEEQNSENGYNLSITNLIKSLSLNKIIEKIDAFNKNEDLKIYTNQSLLVKDENGNDKINYFYLLINIIKQNYYNEKDNIYLISTYYNKELNKVIDLSKLIFNIIGSIFNNEKLYLNEFVGYHFFYTILSKISNEKLKSNYIFDKKIKKYISNSSKSSEMSKDEFIGELTSYISVEEANNFIETNSIIRYRREFIDFVKYLSKLNKILYKINSEIEKIDYNVLKINFSYSFPNNYDNLLFGENGALYFLTKKYIDECINIRNIREQLKNLIQQYTFIGTKRIATDLLYDFFIKNYSKNESIGYFSSDEIIKNEENNEEIIYDFSKVKRSINDLLYGTEINGNFKEDEKFEINIIEYYDLTQYLNIESDLPSTVVENSIINYEDVISTYLDENYLITSSYVKKPVYSTSYAPCSLFVKNYNEKFWENKTLSLNSNINLIQSNEEDYINFYSSYIPEIQIASLNTFKTDYINNNLLQFLDNLWDAFALSSIAENDTSSEIYSLYKEYIGNGLGKNKYINNANMIFPTIAPINSIENLIECKKYDDENLLFLAKNYYANVISKIKIATKKILNMYNNDGVPCEGWKRSYITFHGYSTAYESSNNKLQYSIKTSKLYKNNGPFVYSKLQDVLYEYYLGKYDLIKKERSLESLLSSFEIPSSIYNIYDYLSGYNLNDKKNALYMFVEEQFNGSNFYNFFYDTYLKKDDKINLESLFEYFDIPSSIYDIYNYLSNYNLNDKKNALYMFVKEQFNDKNNFYNFFYNTYLKDYNINLENLLKEYDAPSSIYNVYDYYLNKDGKETFFNFFNNENQKPKIDQYDEDLFENCFTLFKKDNDIAGKLYFRSYTMPISVPLMEETRYFKDIERGYYYEKENYVDILSIIDLDYREILRSVFNNCIEFGLLNKHLWAFGKFENSYKLVSFKYEFKNGFIIPDQSSIVFYENNVGTNSLETLNDFVGAFYDENNIHLVLFNCYELLKDLKDQFLNNENYYDLLHKHKIKFTEVIIDTKTSKFNYKLLDGFNETKYEYISIPMFLNHNENGEINFKNDERIWKILFKDNICYISYKSLSKNIEDDTFNYYLTYNTNIFKVQTINVIWNSEYNYFDLNKNTKLDEMIFELNDGNKNLIFLDNINNNLSDNVSLNDYDKITKFKNQILKFSKCYYKNTKIYSQFSPFDVGLNFTNNFNEFLSLEIIKENLTNVTFESFLNLISSNKEWINNHIWTTDKRLLNKSKEEQYNILSGTYDYILTSIINKIDEENGLLKFTKEYNENDDLVSSTIFERTNEFYKHVPIINNCVINPLKVDIVFKNDTGFTFLNQNAFDLDLTCYIDDEIEKNRKVGYGNVYKKTNFITWDGDVTEGGKESVKIDVNKYIRNKLLNKNTNTSLKIVFNVCWNENSEITTSNVYALVQWNNLLEKYPINICGSNSLSCNTRSFTINIDMITRELTFNESKLYPVISINYKEKLMGYEGEPDIKFGTINLNSNDILDLENNKWIKYSDKLYYKKYKENIINYLIIDDEEYLIEKNNYYTVLNTYKKIITNLFYITNKKSNSDNFILDEIFFGLDYNGDNNTEIDFNYIIYLNPGKFSSNKKLKYKINAILQYDLKSLSYELTEKE